VSGTIVYLDICALKRPFDDARSERIRREAEAVARTFEKVENGSIQLVVFTGSSVRERPESPAQLFLRLGGEPDKVGMTFWSPLTLRGRPSPSKERG
jgi:hypothetical protein